MARADLFIPALDCSDATIKDLDLQISLVEPDRSFMGKMRRLSEKTEEAESRQV